MTADLFGWAPTPKANVAEEARFGTWDAKCGLPLRNYYSERITGDRLAAYEKAFREERATQPRDGAEWRTVSVKRLPVDTLSDGHLPKETPE